MRLIIIQQNKLLKFCLHVCALIITKAAFVSRQQDVSSYYRCNETFRI